MLFVTAMFTQKGVAVYIFFETLLLFCAHFLKHSKELCSNQLRPIESLFVIMLLEILGFFCQNCYIFGSEKPRFKNFNIANLAMLSVFFEQTVQMVDCSNWFQIFFQSLENTIAHKPVVRWKVGSHFEIIWLQVIKLLHASPAEEEIIGLLFVVVLVWMIDLAECVSSSNVLVVLVDLRVDFVL